MRGDDPLNRDLRNALANVLEPVGSSRMEVTLGLKKRGRGRPRNRVALALSLLREGADIMAVGGKPYVEVEEFTKAWRPGKSRARKTGKTRAYKAYRAIQGAKAIREGE